ncbi:hypothetical protein SAMN05444920_1442 [Nonomuraea solani]|uniref:DUF3558 domain-containing protein n=1 Tax=Nonomuraea solani TaxID=1144553 RepID=A0A1H6F2E4_9ACTN|nr:hypothetical protein [Nonomuraea solani]SEH03783.1 hypothetical protein SAMN05444920_1442 [Nonomuraea solani]
MRTFLALLLVTTLTACAADSPPAARSAGASVRPTTPAAVVPDRLRPITGAQVCAAIPEALRESLLPGDLLSDEISWSNTVATATSVWAECEWYFGAPLSLEVTVEAYGTAGQTATDHAKLTFEKSKAEHAKLHERPGSDSWTYSPVAAANHGDAAFSLTGSRSGKRRSRYAYLLIRQGPWLISMTYQGEGRGGDVPEAELRRDADQIAEVFTAEMAEDSGAVAPDDRGLCGAVSAADVASVFFPSVTVVGGGGDADDTDCTWLIREQIGQMDEGGLVNGPCGRGPMQMENVVPRCGELRIRVNDLRRDDRRKLRSGFDAMTGRYAKSAPVKRLTGIGDRAFAFADQVHVLAGGYLIQLTYNGTNTGGGVRDAPGFQEPNLDEAALRKSLIRIAEIYVPGLSAQN